MKGKFISVILACVVVFLAVTPVFAESDASSAEITSQFSSVEEIIQDLYNEDFVAQLIDNGLCPESYWVDPSIYVLEYEASDTFLTELSAASVSSTQDLIGSSLSEHPIIYIPIFGMIQDTERIIGHVKLYYNWLLDKYMMVPLIMNTTFEHFISGEITHFLEDLDALHGFRTVTDAIGDPSAQCTLIRMPGAFNDFTEKVVLVERDNGFLLYDFMNTAHQPEGQECLIASVGEFSASRSVYEAELLENAAPFESMPAKGGSDSAGGTNPLTLIIPILIAVVLALACVVVIVLRQRKQR